MWKVKSACGLSFVHSGGDLCGAQKTLVVCHHESNARLIADVLNADNRNDLYIGAVEWPRKDTDPVTILDEADAIARGAGHLL